MEGDVFVLLQNTVPFDTRHKCFQTGIFGRIERAQNIKENQQLANHSYFSSQEKSLFESSLLNHFIL